MAVTEPPVGDGRDRMRLNPEPLGIVADDDERAISSLIAWRKSATRDDKLRVWLALGGSQEEFDADHPE